MSRADEESIYRPQARTPGGAADWQAFEQAAAALRDALAAHAVQVRHLAFEGAGVADGNRLANTHYAQRPAACACRHAAPAAAATAPPAMATWISVAERLPDAEIDVLCRRQHGDVVHPPIVAGRFRGEWLAFDAEASPVRHVTHWSPLPDWALR